MQMSEQVQVKQALAGLSQQEAEDRLEVGVDGDPAAGGASAEGTTKRPSVLSRCPSGSDGRAQAVRNSLGIPTVNSVSPTCVDEYGKPNPSIVTVRMTKPSAATRARKTWAEIAMPLMTRRHS